MAIQVSTNFNVGTKLPIDSRIVAQNEAALADIASPYEGMIVYLKDEGKFVYYTSDGFVDINNTHTNLAVLDTVTAAKIAEWDAKPSGNITVGGAMVCTDVGINDLVDSGINVGVLKAYLAKIDELETRVAALEESAGGDSETATVSVDDSENATITGTTVSVGDEDMTISGATVSGEDMTV